ncbi:MAG: CpXC domain-containing protein [Polyangia bacterium]
MVKSYSGRSVHPRREQVVYSCPCGERYAAEVWRAISAEDGALRRRLIEGDLNRVRCPRCESEADVQLSVLFHDALVQRLVYVAPSSDRHRELALRAELYTLLAADGVPAPDYVLAAQVVFGSAGLSQLLAPPSVTEAITAMVSVLPPRSEPTVVHETVPDLDAILARSAQVQTVAAKLPETRVPETNVAEPKVAEVPVAIDRDFTQPRATMNVPDPRTAVIERWIAARDVATALFVDEHVVVCAALPDSQLERFAGADIDVSLRPQLHRMASFPLLVLTFVADEDGERPDENRVVHVPLDLSRAAHRVALDQLQRRCTIELELFDGDYLPVVSHTVTVPLEDHVRHLVVEAKQAMDKLPVATRDFDRARAAFFASNYDRLGRTVIELPLLEDVVRGTPAQVRAALAHVARWSEAAAETYLLEIRGFPLTTWRKLAAAVVRRAVEIGLFVPRSLAERAARRAVDVEALDLPPWSELIELQIRRFAELSARLKPSDLQPAEEATNWELLLREADSLRLSVDDAVQRLADAAFQRAGGRPSRRPRPSITPTRARTPGLTTPRPPQPSKDLSSLGSVELLSLLEDRDLRLDAAMALARRRENSTLAPLFALLRRMSRAEASALLPFLVAFGGPAERWLVDGLRSKQSFMRQGCSLALGRLGSPLAIDALVRLLFDEPTEIWTEVARAIGDLGAPAVVPLCARMREVEGDERERIVHALAHISARVGAGQPAARSAVEALATGRDALVANVARRALVLAPEILNAHEQVRAPQREQTLVRAFTRRFYDILTGEKPAVDDDDISELDEEDLIAFETAPEETDGLDDELIEEVSDARIALRDEVRVRVPTT